jgi:hypothetical protein
MPLWLLADAVRVTLVVSNQKNQSGVSDLAFDHFLKALNAYCNANGVTGTGYARFVGIADADAVRSFLLRESKKGVMYVPSVAWFPWVPRILAGLNQPMFDLFEYARGSSPAC